MFKHILQINEQSIIIDFGSKINIEISNIVNLYSKKIINSPKVIKELNIKNCVPSYNKILIQFDPLNSNKRKIIDYLKTIKISKYQLIGKLKIIEIPICYDNICGLDLKEISQIIKLSKNEIIDNHLSTIFHVYMIGFLPGLPFMGDMNKNLLLPRKNSPRVKVPKGSVGIINNLSVIYPQESPGGWNIIGRTPINLFDKGRKNSLLINPGNKIKFKRISLSEYNDYD